MAVTPERMTLAEFLKLARGEAGAELRHGLVRQRPWPTGAKGAIQAWLGAQIYIFTERRELAEGFTSIRLNLAEDSYVVDLAVYLWDRVPVDEDSNLEFYFSSPPDLTVEIQLPGQTAEEMLVRSRELINHGVRVALRVDPEQRNVYILRPDGEVGPLREGDAVDITDVLPEFQLTVSDLFNRMRARPPRRA